VRAGPLHCRLHERAQRRGAMRDVVTPGDAILQALQALARADY